MGVGGGLQGDPCLRVGQEDTIHSLLFCKHSACFFSARCDDFRFSLAFLSFCHKILSGLLHSPSVIIMISFLIKKYSLVNASSRVFSLGDILIWSPPPSASLPLRGGCTGSKGHLHPWGLGMQARQGKQAKQACLESSLQELSPGKECIPRGIASGRQIWHQNKPLVIWKGSHRSYPSSAWPSHLEPSVLSL